MAENKNIVSIGPGGTTTALSSGSKPNYHSLDGNSFHTALERYVDDNKPDPLILKQIQGWEMNWSPGRNDDDNGSSITTNCSSAPQIIMATAELNFVPTDILHGILTWKGDYMVADVETFCCWEPSNPNNNSMNRLETKKNPLQGSLYFLVQVDLRFRTKHDMKQSSKSIATNEERKTNDTIRQKMIQRLQEDAYIKKLLRPQEQTNSQNSYTTKNVLCEARITVNSSVEDQPGQLEERVDVTDNVAEGIRRALFSQAESSLDVVEFLLSLPLLPGAAHIITGSDNNSNNNNNNNSNNNNNNTNNCDNSKSHHDCYSPLADRAKLRLLEDAMFDACEREGEEELIEDLNISHQDKDNKSKSTNNNFSQGTNRQKHQSSSHSQQQQPHQHQQQQKSNKRTKR